MQLKYVDTKEEIIAINRKSKHIEPHLHNALEIVCVTRVSDRNYTIWKKEI